jgi:hypothetical protein
MATTTAATTAAAQQAALLKSQQATLGMPGLVSPYDGTTPFPGLAANGTQYPLEAGTMPGSLAGLDAGRPQVNATNQSALAPNGDITQNVTNDNTYTNKYYNIITSPYGVGGGMYNPAFPTYGGWGGWGAPVSPYGQQAFVDPTTGALIVHDDGGIIGWLKRLFRGY